MNWIILIVAGFCEVGFTYCLGRAKSVEGLAWWGWIAGFLVFTILSMGLLAKATQSLPYGLVLEQWEQFWWEFSFSTNLQPFGVCFSSLRWYHQL